jgi:hypothetical protein
LLALGHDLGHMSLGAERKGLAPEIFV